AQDAALSDKTEAGGVALNLGDASALRAAWAAMMQTVNSAAPDVVLDGALVETMCPRGVELMVGAKRDPGWGTVLLLGLGGIWVEALSDVQLLPSGADEAQVREALGRLRGAKLLAGMRGAPPSDLEAVVRAVLAIDRLMQSVPELTEIDVNPLMVHAKGQGATAPDALVVVTGWRRTCKARSRSSPARATGSAAALPRPSRPKARGPCWWRGAPRCSTRSRRASRRRAARRSRCRPTSRARTRSWRCSLMCTRPSRGSTSSSTMPASRRTATPRTSASTTGAPPSTSTSRRRSCAPARRSAS